MPSPELRATVALLVITALCVAAPIGCDAGADGPAPVSAGVYAELLGFDAVEATLPQLGDAALTVAVPEDRVGDASLAALLRAAHDRGVDVRVWLLLSQAEGYWPNETNVDAFRAAAVRLLDWLDAEHLTASTVVVDLEPGYAYSVELASMVGSGLDGTLALMRTHLDEAAFEVAREQFTEVVRSVQARGLRVECVTYPMVVDDAADGDDDLQDALDIPVRGVPWDEVSFMVYQTAFAAGLSGRWVGPSIVGSYAADAHTLFGARATIALGLVGRSGVPPPTGPVYEDPTDLAADVGAARAAGITRVEVYSLDGMQLQGGPARWLDVRHAPPEAAPPTSYSRLVRSLASGIDGSLAM